MKFGGSPTSTNTNRQAKNVWLEGITIGQFRSYTVKEKRDILKLIN